MTDKSAAWSAFQAAAKADGHERIADLFAEEPRRLPRMTLEAAGLYLDLSKQPWSADGFDIAIALAEAHHLDQRIADLFFGRMVNRSEKRAALHVALRAPDGSSLAALGEPVSGEVEAIRNAMHAFAEGVRSGEIRTALGKPFKAVLHIGIGGSDLGPRLVWEALRPLDAPITLRFAANIDPSEFAAATHGIDPAETLVVVVSKSFTTAETSRNAEAARAWLVAALGETGADAHLVAVSTNIPGARAFGVAEDRIFAFRDWVGGRYSIWSAVGLSCAIGLGWEVFAELLDGAAAMDAHFIGAPLDRNAPVLLALAHIFNRNGLGRPTRAVVPYARRLALFPDYLQQLEMESNGKQVTNAGKLVVRASAAAVFGDAGTNGQHAFFQMLHQGPDIIPVDFIAVAHEREGPAGHQSLLLANALAQAEALMAGKANPQEPHRNFPGNRPSSFILMERLTPRTLGALIALHEHKTYVEGVLWDIDTFDQWGVELGKVLAVRILNELTGGEPQPHDPSTAALIARLSDGQ